MIKNKGIDGMQAMVVKVSSSTLKPHEKIRKTHLKKLGARIVKDGFLQDPIIVDKNTMIILDGHHRFRTLQLLGLSLVPCVLVDYAQDLIQVFAWREGDFVTKHHVLGAGLSGKLMRPKTSRHLIFDRPQGMRILLTELK